MTERTHKDVVKSDISAWGQTAFLKNFSLMFVLGSFFNLSTSILLYFKVWFNSSADTVWTCWTSMSHTWITCMIHGQIQKHQHTHTTPPNLFSNVMAAIAFSFFIFFLQFKQKKKNLTLAGGWELKWNLWEYIAFSLQTEPEAEYWNCKLVL